jgi:TatD family-associated radical SAM protein
MTITYGYGNALYVNITNRCSCDCVFCLRRHGEGVNAGQSLWLPYEPSLEEISAAIEPVDFAPYDEIVFCGYGEPCERLDTMIYTAGLIRSKTDLPIRLNTNGLSDLINGRETAAGIAPCFDRVSVSLNAPDRETYYNLCRPVFGMDSFDAVIKFALACKERISDTRMSVVSRSLTHEQRCKCHDLCASLGLRLRER